MDPRRAVKKYIGPSPIMTGFAIVSAVLTVVFFLLAVFNADSSSMDLWMTFALMALLFALGFGIVALCYGAVANKHLNRLEQLGLLEKAAAELEKEGNQQINKDQARLSANFVFGKHSGFVARYEDIVWCYRKNVRSNLVIVNSFLFVATRFGSERSLTGAAISDKNNAFQLAAGLIARKNPKVMFGYTNQNRKAYKQIRKAEKENPTA